LLHLLDDLNQALVARALGEEHRLNSFGSSGSLSIAGVIVAQLERRFIKERQREGIERAKAVSVYRGGKRRIDRKQLFAKASTGNALPLLRNLRRSRMHVYRVLASERKDAVSSTARKKSSQNQEAC
jgi:DNA invertase Pin-like site-specific DNA recombinase